MSADEAYLIIRGLRTLDVRLKKHYENTKIVINFLKKQKKISMKTKSHAQFLLIHQVKLRMKERLGNQKKIM